MTDTQKPAVPETRCEDCGHPGSAHGFWDGCRLCKCDGFPLPRAEAPQPDSQPAEQKFGYDTPEQFKPSAEVLAKNPHAFAVIEVPKDMREPAPTAEPPKPPKGKWICNNCGNTEDREREILCWKCGKGEMLYTRAKPEPPAPSPDLDPLRFAIQVHAEGYDEGFRAGIAAAATALEEQANSITLTGQTYSLDDPGEPRQHLLREAGHVRAAAKLVSALRGERE